ncbi:hypothetical protein SAMN02745975_00549 [Geosporobacter subterraneus DSM 17957]|uniref:Uncharacterized protein n=1 Tax=Geosporobacter subterraneus DSM 17957 TaxID=1121919 RepID=A0A1M6DRW4_9FIRM|nr:hypothetical protein SAMN02745975_00549 [Geosporobacter subterraneus DSM 17957]
MDIGDKVFIFDLGSDLYCKTGVIIAIDGETAVVMVQQRQRRGKDCIVDRFRMDKLYRKMA